MYYKENWGHTKDVLERWWCKELDFPVLQAYAPKTDVEHYRGFDWWAFAKPQADPQAAIEQFQRDCRKMYFGGEAVPSLFPNMGPGVLAAYFHGFLQFSPESQTVWFEKPMSWYQAEHLEFSKDNHWWQYTEHVAKLCAKAGKDEFIVGATDIGGVMDVLASFRGTNELLTDLVMEPERVLSMSERIEVAWTQVYNDIAAIIGETQEGTSSWMSVWCPGQTYPLQCDISAMLSPKMFEEFVAPSLQRQCRNLDFSFYHWDGPGQIPHLDLLLEIPELDGIQWVPGAGVPQCDSPQWFSLYKKILAHDKLLALQVFDDNRNIPALLESLPNTGRVLITSYFPTENDASGFIASTRKDAY